ncbi:MAG TPA: CCA tRNA nucleotidyltransferase [Candidatus Binatia bacterium]|nr:CCA tRNA nucleotidyltransferase [Candidatus Binatia bacterium]
MLRAAALSIVRTLQEHGHQAVFAGGCVRDMLLGQDPSDYDIATSARPEDVEALFEKTVPVGRQFGILLVPAGGHHFEVATFREDAEYLDGRRPTAVHYSGIEADALRRDFTINAMFHDPVAEHLLDYVGGRADLEAGVIRAVGDPGKRFAEDRLRLLRAVRFAARFGFPIEASTGAAIARAAPHIKEVSDERIGEDIVRMLTEGDARRAFELMEELGLLSHVLPEISALKSCMQSPDFHPEGDVFVHTMLCLGHLPRPCSETLALGVLLHDVAKPACAATTEDGRRTFYGHPGVGAEMAIEICRRLRRSNAVAERVAWLVDQHLRHTSAAQMRASTLKRFLRQDGIEELLELTRIDALSSSGDLSHYEFARKALAELAPEQMRPPRLLTGEDLKDMGLAPGPAYRDILQAVEDAQLEGTVTSREQAIELVRSRFAV